MRSVICFIMTLTVVVGIARMASATSPNATTPRYLAYVPDEHMPVLDGVISPGEYDWVPERFIYSSIGRWGVDPGDWPRMVADTEPAPEDFSVPFLFLGWNDTYNVLVVVAQVIDDVGYGYDRAWGDTWRGVDTIYMYLDADHDHGPYQYEGDLNAEEAQQMICRPDLYEAGSAAAVFTHYSGLGPEAWAYAEPYTQVAYNWDYATGSYTIEFTMTTWDWNDMAGPDSSQVHDLEAGQIIGMRLTLLDVDSEEDWAAFTVTSPSPEGADHAFTSDFFEDFTLLSYEETFPPVTAWLPHALASAGDTVAVPVLLSDVTDKGIVSAGVWVGYDPGLLTPLSGNSTKTAGTLLEGLDWQVVVNDTTAGVMKVALATAADTLAGEGPLIFLNFVVSASAVHGDSSALSFEKMLLNEFQPLTIDGSITVATYGDVSDNGEVTSLDASLILQQCVDLIDLGSPPYASYALSAADVTGYHGVTAYDASHVLQYAAGMIDHFPVEEEYERLGPPKTIAGYRVVSLGTVHQTADGSLLLPVLTDQMEGVLSGQLELRFDPQEMKAVDVQKSELTQGYLVVSRISEGAVQIAFAGAQSSPGAGEMFSVRFKLASSDIASLSGTELSKAEFNEGSLQVHPDSWVGFDPIETHLLAELFQNYPNPFNPQTTIAYRLSEPAYVRLSVYNTAGQLVKVLAEGNISAGLHTVAWDATDDSGRRAASGVYLYRIEGHTSSGTAFGAVKKMILLR